MGEVESLEIKHITTSISCRNSKTDAFLRFRHESHRVARQQPFGQLCRMGSILDFAELRYYYLFEIKIRDGIDPFEALVGGSEPRERSGMIMTAVSYRLLI